MCCIGAGMCVMSADAVFGSSARQVAAHVENTEL